MHSKQAPLTRTDSKGDEHVQAAMPTLPVLDVEFTGQVVQAPEVALR